MTPAEILSDCRRHGVKVFLLPNGNLNITGQADAVGKVRPFIKDKKASIVRYLTSAAPPALQPSDADLIREFMELDGLSQEEAQAMAEISIKPRPADEWLALIAELDRMIDRYCLAAGLPIEKLADLLAVRNRQALASIPASLTWFRREIEALEQQASARKPAPARERLTAYASRDSAKAARRRLTGSD